MPTANRILSAKCSTWNTVIILVYVQNCARKLSNITKAGSYCVTVAARQNDRFSRAGRSGSLFFGHHHSVQMGGGLFDVKVLVLGSGGSSLRGGWRSCPPCRELGHPVTCTGLRPATSVPVRR